MPILQLQNHTLEKIREDIGRIYEDLASCDVVMADIQADTRDSRVIELSEICRALEMAGGVSDR